MPKFFKHVKKASQTEIPPEEKAGFEKVIPQTEKKQAPKESKTRRVAKFLILVGSEEASKILSNLDDNQVLAISKEIARIHSINADEAAEILKEFNDLFKNNYAYGGVSLGGDETARRLLYGAFGPEQGEKIFKKSMARNDEQVFDFLEDLSNEQVSIILRDESPATQAMILARIKPQLSARVLAAADPKNRVEIAKRIAKGATVSPEVLETVSNALKEKMRKMGADKATGEKIDGMGKLAAILRYSDVSFGDKLIRDMDVENPKISEGLKKRLYTLDDIPKTEDKALQTKLRDMNDHDIALLLRGRDQVFTEKILSNVSAQRRAVIGEENELIGPVSKQEVDDIVDNFMAWFRNGREQGTIMMNDDMDLIV